MFIPLSQSKVTNQNSSKNASFIILFSLTTNDRDEIDQLKHVFQQYHMSFQRFTARNQNDFSQILPRLSQNANLIA